MRLATHKPTGLTVAIKSYDKKKLEDPMKRKNVEREIKNLSRLNHPNIIKLYQVLESQNQFHLVMEDANAMPLNDFIKAKRLKYLSEEDGKYIIRQLCSALKYCHKKFVAHRDIKLENIMIDPNKRLKLIDFGFSVVIPPDCSVNVFCGTPSYMSPEIVNKKVPAAAFHCRPPPHQPAYLAQAPPRRKVMHSSSIREASTGRAVRLTPANRLLLLALTAFRTMRTK